jgi:hypothetical protein
MKYGYWQVAVAVLFLCVGAASGQAAPATDSDSDGIPDSLERRLGADPNAAEKLEAVWENPAPAAADPSRDLRKLFLANVAGNRYLWVLEFAADFPLKNTNLTVFVDADNNPQHGQKAKDYLGTDFVMWLSDGGRCCHGYSIPGEGTTPAPTRFGWLGRRVYLCTDMPLAQEGSRTHCRALARCEVLEPRTEVSATGWAEIRGPGETERARPAIVAVEPEAFDAADSDGDGISNGAEQRLGTDPQVAERLDVLWDAARAPDVARRSQRRAKSPERSLTRLSFGNVAGDRFLWCAEFAADYPSDNSVFILYLDADNDATTGRKDMPGCDYMLSMSSGGAGISAIAPTGEYSSGPPLRAYLDGKRLYLCADLPLHQDAGQSVYRATVLSERRTPAWSNSTNWFPVQGAGISQRKKVFSLEGCTANEGMAVTRGLDLFRQVKNDPANAVVKIGNCDFQGFEDDMRAEYKESSAVRTAPGGTIIAAAPKDGRFYVGFLLYDQPGTERLEIRHAGKRLGAAVADEDDKRTKLFFTQAAYDFKAGDPVELRTANTDGSYRVEDLVFLAKTPEIRPRALELTDLEATPVWEGDAARPGTMRVTWITTWPARCTVKYTAAGAAGETVEKEAVANHRVYLEGLKVGETCQLQVLAPKPKGGEVASQPITFSTAPVKVPAKTQRASVPLEVENPSGDVLTGWPVTSGVPFPKGSLDSVGHMRLLDPQGKERPLQAQSLVRWPDGSVKWALVSFRADVPAEASAGYALEYGTKVTPADVRTSLSVNERAEGVAIVTGPMRLEISKSALGLPGKVWLDKNGDGQFSDEELVCGEGKSRGHCVLADASGRQFTTLGPAEEITVEERGPERVCVLVKGHHVAQDGARLFAYEARILAYAGQKFVRLFYTFGNDELKSDFTSLRELRLELPIAGGATRFEMGSEAKPIVKGATAGRTGPTHQGETAPSPLLFQDSDDHYRFAAGAAGAEGKRAAGWVRASGPRAAMTVAVRDFWQLYPKAISVDAQGIKLGIMPPLADDQYDQQAKDPVKLVHHYYNLLGGRYKIKQGQTKTHEILISFADDKSCGLDAFQQGVMAVAPSAWVCDSLALGQIAPTGTEWSTPYDGQMEKCVANYLKARDRGRDYGMMNYGDWWGERRFNWGNIEYDDAHVWMLHFARTGDMRAFLLGDRAAKHYGDVDCIHYSPYPSRLGAGYSHCLGHVGGFFQENPVEGGTLQGGSSPCHTRTEGLVEHYLLTGDRRSRDAALGIAEHFDGAWLNNYDMSNCRVPGWHIVLTMSLYQATADPFYLNAAKIIGRRAIERAHPDGGWRRCLVPGHCFDLPRHRGEAGFMVGVLLAGMKYYHEATGDPQAADVLVKASRWLVRETYDPASNQFRYTSCPNSSKPSTSPSMACEGFAYAARLTGASDLATLTRDVAKDLVSRTGGSNPSAIRFLPRTLWDLDRLASPAR